MLWSSLIVWKYTWVRSYIKAADKESLDTNNFLDSLNLLCGNPQKKNLFLIILSTLDKLLEWYEGLLNDFGIFSFKFDTFKLFRQGKDQKNDRIIEKFAPDSEKEQIWVELRSKTIQMSAMGAQNSIFSRNVP